MTLPDAVPPSSSPSLSLEVRQRITQARARVAALHAELTRWNLVVWTAGNISERVPVRNDGEPSDADLLVIKPSGVSYEELTPDSMVVCDLHGTLVEGRYSPSSDTSAHAYVYRHMPQVGGVVHTHSPYATAWAATGQPIPCALTMMADEFGGDIPVGPFAIIGDESIGRGIVDTLRNSTSSAVLMKGHGPFTVGANAKAAVKSAVLLEEVAKTLQLAQSLGPVHALPRDITASLFERYHTAYGQKH